MEHVDLIAELFAQDVIKHLTGWMGLTYGDEVSFHRYRMKLLSMMKDSTATQKLQFLADRVASSQIFEIKQLTQDKMLGESFAKYILAQLVVKLNSHYLKILEIEQDRVKDESHKVGLRILKLKDKLAQH